MPSPKSGRNPWHPERIAAVKQTLADAEKILAVCKDCGVDVSEHLPTVQSLKMLLDNLHQVVTANAHRAK